jgi:hypothetical protein
MLTPPQLGIHTESAPTRRSRPLPSPKQRYDEYVLQRIEDYKESISRGELLKLGNDAFNELQAAEEAEEGQYFLTEVLIQESVDRLIRKRLGLPTYSRWRQKFARLRQAQQSPTHWGIERRSAIGSVLPRLEPGDHALVVGGGAEAVVCLLAAHDVRVTCLCPDDATCTRIETRVSSESLTGEFEALAVNLGTWFPTLPLPAHLVVIDAATLAELPGRRRLALMAQLQDITIPGGLHAVVPGHGTGAVEAWVSLYPDWERVPLPNESPRRGTKRPAPPGILLCRPIPQGSAEATTA